MPNPAKCNITRQRQINEYFFKSLFRFWFRHSFFLSSQIVQPIALRMTFENMILCQLQAFMRQINHHFEIKCKVETWLNTDMCHLHMNLVSMFALRQHKGGTWK